MQVNASVILKEIFVSSRILLYFLSVMSSNYAEGKEDGLYSITRKSKCITILQIFPRLESL